MWGIDSIVDERNLKPQFVDDESDANLRLGYKTKKPRGNEWKISAL